MKICCAFESSIAFYLEHLSIVFDAMISRLVVMLLLLPIGAASAAVTPAVMPTMNEERPEEIGEDDSKHLRSLQPVDKPGSGDGATYWKSSLCTNSICMPGKASTLQRCRLACDDTANLFVSQTVLNAICSDINDVCRSGGSFCRSSSQCHYYQDKCKGSVFSPIGPRFDIPCHEYDDVYTCDDVKHEFGRFDPRHDAFRELFYNTYGNYMRVVAPRKPPLEPSQHRGIQKTDIEEFGGLTFRGCEFIITFPVKKKKTIGKDGRGTLTVRGYIDSTRLADGKLCITGVKASELKVSRTTKRTKRIVLKRLNSDIRNRLGGCMDL